MTLIDWLQLPAENWTDSLTRSAFADFLEESGDVEKSAIIREIRFDIKVNIWVYGEMSYQSIYGRHSKFIQSEILKLFTDKCKCVGYYLAAPEGGVIFLNGWMTCPNCNGKKWVLKKENLR